MRTNERFKPEGGEKSMRVVGTFLLIGLLVVLAGCSRTQPEAGEPEAGDLLQVTLLPAPEGVGGETLSVQLVGSDGGPITNASVSLEGNMNHAGMVPVVTPAVTDDVDGDLDGVYWVPFAFTMHGDWIITVFITLADGSTLERNVDVTVTAETVTVND
jgi:hypothetical protein